MKVSKNKYNQLLAVIGLTIETARSNAIKAVNAQLVKANWEIGRHIIEFEQEGNERAEYGSDLLARLSKDLQQKFGKGFGRRNVLDMRRFESFKHTDIGQMNLYLNYFKTEENIITDSDPIGIILTKDKDEVLVEYAMGGLSNKIFVSKYQLYLPDKKTLQKQVNKLII